MQLSRLRIIKTALTENLNNHPLSSANSASFLNDTSVNSRINATAAAAGISPAANVFQPYSYSEDTVPYASEELILLQQASCPKAEGHVETHPKVRLAQALTASAAGASKSLTLN
jgi:hypothetical protein